MEENVRIVITGDNKDALKKVNQVEKAVNDLNQVSQQVEIGVKGINKVEREVARLYTALEKLESAALSKLPRSVQVVITYLKAATQAAGELGGRLAFAGVQVDNLSKAKFIPAGLLPAAKEVENFTVKINLSIEAVRRLGDAMTALYAKALPRAGGSQGFTGFLRYQGPAFLPGLGGGGGLPGLPGIGGSGGGRGGALALRSPGGALARRADVTRDVFTFDATTLRGLREGAEHLREMMETARIGSPEFRRYEEGLTRLNNAIRDAQLKGQKSGIGTPTSRGSIAALRQQSEALTAALEQAEIGSKRFRELERSLFNVNKQIRRTEDSIRGTEGRNKLGAALIGGAFPLLFGQGPGAAIGGAIGETFGPMGGIVGTAIGAPIDQFIASTAQLGQALNVLTADLEAVVAASGQANTAFAQNIKALEEAGLQNTALEVATRQLANVVGKEGVNELRKFGDDTTRLTQTFAAFISNMQAGIANLINSSRILQSITNAIEEILLFDQVTRSQDPRVVAAREKYFTERSTYKLGGASEQAAAIETARVRMLAIQRQVNREQLDVSNKQTRNALAQKRNLDEAKRQLDTQQKLATTGTTRTGLIEKQAEAQRAQSSFDERRNDIVTNYEKSLANLRRSIENQISTLRIENLRKANQIEDQRAANALTQLRNQQKVAQLLIQGPGTQNPLLAREAQILRDSADAFALKTQEAQAKRAKIERDSALTVEEIQFRSDKFKLDAARQSAELQLNAQKQIDRINKNIVDRNAKFSEERFNTEKLLAGLRLKVLQAEVAFEVQKLSDKLKPGSGLSVEQTDAVREQQRELSTLSAGLAKEEELLKQVKTPDQLTQVADVTKASIDLSSYNRLAQQRVELEEKIKNLRLEAADSEVESAALDRLQSIVSLLREVETQESINAARRAQASEKEVLVAQLIKELGSRSRAEEIAGIRIASALKQEKLTLLETELLSEQALLEAKAAKAVLDDAEVERLEIIAELLDRINKARGLVITNTQDAEKGAKGEIQKFIEQAEAELNNFEAMAVRVSEGIGNAIGNSLNNGISQLIEGSATVKEVFADMLKSVGQVLVQEATKMIATYIAIGIARAFAGLSNADAGSGKFAERSTKIFDGSSLYGQAPIPFKANGGPVQSGQPYMVGERGPELFVPSTNGGVMRNEDMRQLMGRSPVGNAPAMNFTFETTNIGGTEYVSREQLEAAMATTRRQAAADGANRGMNMTLDKMQNSPRTRSRIGIG